VAAGKFGATNNVITVAPDQTETYNGFDFQVNARMAHGIVLSGGTSTGRTEIDQCFKLGRPDDVFAGSAANVIAPRTEAYCDTKPPFQAQYKAYGVLPLPWFGIRTSATFKSFPGPQVQAAAPFTSAQINQLGLGRPLAGNVASVIVDLIPAGTLYGDRLKQLDWRVSKTLQLPQARRMSLNFDIYNAFNANAVLNQNNTFGSSWQNPTLIVGGRLIKFSGQFDF
jgi:hypothetical protein